APSPSRPKRRHHILVHLFGTECQRPWSCRAVLQGFPLVGPFYTGDPVGAISVSLQGGDIIIIGTMLNRIPGSLVARKEIRQHLDLRGKKIGVANFGGGTELSVILALKKWRMSPEAVTLIQSGVPPDRLTALMKGALDASPLAPPHSFEAARRGL